MQKMQYKKMYELEDKHFWFLAKREYLKSIYHPPDKNINILDLGCGTGGTSKILSSWGKVVKVECSPYAFKYLKKRGLDFIGVRIEKYEFPKDKFDLVCLLDVLYHRNIKDIKYVLDNAYKTLNPGGRLLITDCALPYLYSHHDETMMARKRFYLSEMVALVTNSGFYVEKKSYIYFFIFPIFLIVRMLDKFISLNTVAENPKLINNLLFSICRFEAFLLKYISFPIGSSIIIKARKK